MGVDSNKMSTDKSLEMAMKAEEEAAAIYTLLKNKVRNFIMKDKLSFLVSEEEKHKRIIRDLYTKLFPENEIVLPEQSFVPGFDKEVSDETPVVDLLREAMEAEKKSMEFYLDLSERVEEKSAAGILKYLAKMEQSHYSLIEGEYELALNDQQYLDREDFMYDMVHIGP